MTSGLLPASSKPRPHWLTSLMKHTSLAFEESVGQRGRSRCRKHLLLAPEINIHRLPIRVLLEVVDGVAVVQPPDGVHQLAVVLERGMFESEVSPHGFRLLRVVGGHGPHRQHPLRDGAHVVDLVATCAGVEQDILKLSAR